MTLTIQKSYRYDIVRVIVTVTISPINKINNNNIKINNQSIVIVTVTLSCVLSLRYLFQILKYEFQ